MAHGGSDESAPARAHTMGSIGTPPISAIRRATRFRSFTTG